MLGTPVDRHARMPCTYVRPNVLGKDAGSRRSAPAPHAAPTSSVRTAPRESSPAGDRRLPIGTRRHGLGGGASGQRIPARPDVIPGGGRGQADATRRRAGVRRDHAILRPSRRSRVRAGSPVSGDAIGGATALPAHRTSACHMRKISLARCDGAMPSNSVGPGSSCMKPVLLIRSIAVYPDAGRRVSCRRCIRRRNGWLTFMTDKPTARRTTSGRTGGAAAPGRGA